MKKYLKAATALSAVYNAQAATLWSNDGSSCSNPGWSDTNGGSCQTYTSCANDGSTCMSSSGGTNISFVQYVNTKGYDDVRIGYSLLQQGQDVKEDDFCYVKYSTNAGSSWTTAATYDQEDQEFTDVVINCDVAADNNPNFGVKFETVQQGDTDDYCNWWDMLVLADFIPTRSPTKYPTNSPSKIPSKSPTDPSSNPTNSPSKIPSKIPSISPTKYPTNLPNKTPTKTPTKSPTNDPTNNTNNPSISPTKYPTKYPTINPTKSPTTIPSKSPSKTPSMDPTQSPANPSNNPTFYPSNNPIITVPVPSPTRSPLKFCANDGYNNKKRFKNKNNDIEFCEFCVCTDIGNEYCATIATVSEEVQDKFMSTCGFDDQCSFDQIGLKHSDSIKECGCEMFECQPITNDGYAIMIGLLIYFAIVNVVFMQ